MMHRVLALVATALSLGLCGCITLFPKEAPAQLYRFEADLPPATAAATPFSVRASPLDFDTPAAGDQMMTSDGDQVAYIGGARWSAPASDLFEDAVEHGFATAGGPARLVGPGAPGRDDYRLQLQVTRFEATYPSGPKAAPTIVVRLRATLLHEKDLAPAGERLFEATIPAADNHVSDIVTAYDAATTKVVGELVAWVGQGGG